MENLEVGVIQAGGCFCGNTCVDSVANKDATNAAANALSPVSQAMVNLSLSDVDLTAVTVECTIALTF